MRVACNRSGEKYKNLHISSSSTSTVEARAYLVRPSVTMHTALYLVALAGIAYSAPQLINLDAISEDFPPPDLVTAPINVVSDIPPDSAPDPIIPLESSTAKKRDFVEKRDLVEKRDGDCSPYPAGSGPVPSPDTPSAFTSDPAFAVCHYHRLAELRRL